jgi:hypothetical protein
MTKRERPLHASAYEPLTPFKPRNSTEEAIVSRIKDPRGPHVVVVHGGDQISGRLHDDRS